MSQNLQNFVKFQKFQLENLVDFENAAFWKNPEKNDEIWRKFSRIWPNKPLRFAPRRRGGGLEGICRAEVDSRTAASPRGETIAVQQ